MMIQKVGETINEKPMQTHLKCKHSRFSEAPRLQEKRLDSVFLIKMH